jgi:ATP-dependent DNA helicase RecQ
MAEFHALEEALRVWPRDLPDASAFAQPSQRRLAQALRGFRDDPTSVGTGDLAGLVRQVLRFESLKRGHEMAIDVPATEGWPSRDEWGSFGVDVRLQFGKTYRIAARPWSPSWSKGLTDDLAVEGPERAPPASTLRADPLLEQDLQIKSFRSPGQAAALRAMSLLPPNQTLVVSLPTGSGKSLLFQAAAIKAGRRGNLTVVVVPTTALAIDQEGRMQALLRHALHGQAAYPVAYHSGLSVEERDAFRKRLRDGEQSVVIASPEAVVGALRVTLQKAAEQGRLAWCAIDEAHIVSQWGEYFRPEFQFLAASVASWRRAAPPNKALRTLLLTATLTDESLDTLRTLFAPASALDRLASSQSDGDGFHVLVAPQLRAEPDYWVVPAPDENTRRRWILEAIRQLPRPMVVYTAKPDDATTLAALLSEELRLKRVVLFRGGDAATTRGANNLLRWNRGEVDIVVATSAFGLGMDKGDVRAVVHACVPETVDRFYQEVGRGGRDGCASLSLWVHTPRDREVAADLARNRQISLDRGWERWEAMRVNAKRVPDIDDAWSVRLDDKPVDLFEENTANRAWNVRTLVLMARAGLISLGTPKITLPERQETESDPDYEERHQASLIEAFGRAVVIAPKSVSPETWRRAIAAAASNAGARDAGDRERLDDLIGARRPFNEVFREAYTVTLDDRRVAPIPFPGQCPVTRERPTYGGQSHQTGDFAFTKTLLADLAKSVNLRGVHSARHYWITYEVPDLGRAGMRTWIEQLNKLLQHLVSGGIVEIALPDDWQSKVDVKRLVQVAAHGYVVLRGLRETDPLRIDGAPADLPLPRVTILPPDTDGRDVERLLDLQRPMHIIMLPDNVTDPDRPDRLFVATRRHDRLAPLLERWSL